MNREFNFEIGDVVQIAQVDKQPQKKDRIANFKGQIIKLRGEGSSRMVTVRATMEGVVVDRIFPIQSPLIKDIKLVEKPKKAPRRARLFLQSAK